MSCSLVRLSSAKSSISQVANAKEFGVLAEDDSVLVAGSDLEDFLFIENNIHVLFLLLFRWSEEISKVLRLSDDVLPRGLSRIISFFRRAAKLVIFLGSPAEESDIAGGLVLYEGMH